MKTKIAVTAFALCLTLGAIGASAQLSGLDKTKPAETPNPAAATAPLPGGAGAPDKAMAMGAECKMMQGEMSKMEKDMQQGQQKLEKLLGAMNAAEGPARIDSLIAVVNEMGAQSAHMHTMHSEMMQKMMQHMSAHMMDGPGPKAQAEMMKCPMMQDQGGGEHSKLGPVGKPDSPQGGDDHSAHHPPAKQ